LKKKVSDVNQNKNPSPSSKCVLTNAQIQISIDMFTVSLTAGA